MKISRRKLFGGLAALPVLGLLGREKTQSRTLPSGGYAVANKRAYIATTIGGTTTVSTYFADHEYVFYRPDGSPLVRVWDNDEDAVYDKDT